MKKFVVTLFTMVALIASSLSAHALSYNGHEYELVQGYYWTDAETAAVAWGGHLVTINDAAEDAWLFANFGFKHYIGLNDIDQEGTYEWVSGEAVTYTHWAGGEPNNVGNEDWTQINWGYDGSGGWNDIGAWGAGYASGYGIAEKSNAVPEPSTLILLGSGLVGLAGMRRRFKA